MTLKLRIMGGKWKPTDNIAATVSPDTPLKDSASALATALGLETASDLVDHYTLHPYKDKKIGDAMDLSQSPKALGLDAAPFIYLRGKAAAAAAPAAPAGERPKKAVVPAAPGPKPSSPSATVPPPPPQPKAVASNPAAPLPPPPPKATGTPAGTPAAPPPPPPPKKVKAPAPGGTGPEGAKAPPPPPPKKGPPATMGFSAPNQSAADSDTGSGSDSDEGQGAPPVPAPASAPPPPPPPKKINPAPAMNPKSAPPPPQPKKTPSALPKPAKKNSDDDSDSGDDRRHQDGGGTTMSRPPGASKFPVEADMLGSGSDDSGDSDSSREASPQAQIPAHSSPSAPPPPPAVKQKVLTPAPTGVAPAPPRPVPGKTGSTAASAPSAPVPTALPQKQINPAPQYPSTAIPHHNDPAAQFQTGTPSAYAASGSAAPPQYQAPIPYVVPSVSAGAPQDVAQLQEAVKESIKAKAELSAMVNVAEERLTTLQKQQQLEDRERMEKLQREVTSSVTREIQNMRDNMTQSFESQRSVVLQQQNDLELARRDLLVKLVERERQLHEAQTELLSKFQKRVINQSNGGSQAIEELRLTNQMLREKIESLNKKQESASDAELQHVLQIQCKLVETMNEIHRRGSTMGSPSQSFQSPQKLSQLPEGSSPVAQSSDRALMLFGPKNDGTAILRMQELQRFLGSLGLEKFVEPLMMHDVDVAALSAMSDLEMEHVGITTVGARRRIQIEIERRRHLHLQSRTLDGDSYFSPQGAAVGLHSSSMPSGIGHSPAALTNGGVHLTQKQFDLHAELLDDFFEEIDPPLQARVSVMLTTFGHHLDDLYAALATKYEVKRSPFRGLLIHFLKRSHSHLLPAIDIICHVHSGREAEFAENLECIELGLNRQAHCWLGFQRQPAEPNGEAPPVFYYNALVRMSQWEIPKILIGSSIRVVHEMDYRSVPGQGTVRGPHRDLQPNPVDVDICRSQVYQYSAAIVALLMRYEPQRLAERDELFAKYRKREHILLAELQALYGTGEQGLPAII